MTIIGAIILYIFHDIIFNNIYINIIKYFIPIYIIATGFEISVLGYLKNTD